ncbi:hypothetical protein ABES35_06310 [Bacillus subtilis]|uniref:hypothetical protein n=1 Tax=Bacillus subtilis TaxID=1423 RepID=UPI0027AB3EB2|nr:hypothetical protein [Bacillus subtilis]MEC2400498.1 hypothetical protein [Bacillus subtilis]MED4667507.1 hypothetical protein [Bacillus subtilis]WEZ26747.1 hypothetical protein P5635_00120 [Bacillus subtilis]
MKPASKRLKGHRKQSHNSLNSLDEKLISSLHRIIPNSIRIKVNNFIMGSGQSKDWSAEKLFVLSPLLFLIGCMFTIIFSVLLNNLAFLMVGVLFAVLLSSFPFLYILSAKKQYLSRLVFAANDFIDVLQKEMVYGSGNPQIALEKARQEATGDLRQILTEVNKQLEKDRGNYYQALIYLEKTVPHPLYKDIVLVLNTGYESGRYKKMFKSLQRNCKNTISETIRKQTASRGLMITSIALMLVVNLMILLLFPMIVTLFSQFQNISL